MTRQEAYSIATQSNLVAHPKRIVDILEALGLLKFDKEEKSLSVIIHRARSTSNSSPDNQDAFLEYLKSNGYIIVRNKP